MHNQLKRTLVISTRENHVWTSMQEIIPSLEEAWQQTASETHQVKCVLIEDVNIAKLLKGAMISDTLVFTTFSTRIAKFAYEFRNSLSDNQRYIFHLHSMATIGCWPLYEWKMGEILTDDDILISTSTRDYDCLRHIFENAKGALIPFHLSKLNEIKSGPLPAKEEIPFCYVGRISSQKSLHTLIYAFSLFKKQNPNLKSTLSIYGKEDNLYSPNMGIGGKNYQEFLETLSHRLDVNDVVFRGFVDRRELERELQEQKHILLSASMHSDENFGIAALRGLCGGHQAVLSDWGGHTDFKTFFPRQVELIPVSKRRGGPYISPFEFSKAMEKVAKNYSLFIHPHLPDYYSLSEISKKLQKLAFTKRSSSRLPLKRTPLSKKIHENRKHFFKEMREDTGNYLPGHLGCRIFKDYTDSTVHPLLGSYGMNDLHDSKMNLEKKILLLSPWVEVSEEMIKITDPHKGEKALKRKQSLLNIPCKSPLSGDLFLREDEVHFIFEHGGGELRNLEGTTKFLCSNSMTMLKERIHMATKVHPEVKHLFIPDLELDHEVFHQDVGANDVVDVFLFGSFFESILESGMWPFNKFRLWAMSSPVKRCLNEMLGIPLQNMGVIPRELLFPPGKEIPANIDAPINFVYAGRISESKNIKLLISFFHDFQKRVSPLSKLTLYGAFDTETNDFINPVNPSFKEELYHFISSLDWNHIPIFKGEYHHLTWQKETLPNQVMINFSTFHKEDFGVAVAQGEELGMPVILSDWGGHQDVLSSNTIKVPSHLLKSSKNSNLLEEGKNLSQFIEKNLELLTASTNQRENPPLQLPSTLSQNELDLIRRDFSKRRKIPFTLYQRGRVRDFYLIKEGRAILQEKLDYFSLRQDEKNFFNLLQEKRAAKRTMQPTPSSD